MFGKYGRTGSANMAEQVRRIQPNRFGHIGRTLAEPFGSAEHSSAKKWFGSVRQKQGSVDHYKKCSFWVVFWGFLSPWGPRGVQVGPRCWQATGILSHTMPQPSQVPLWAFKSEICKKCSFWVVFWGFLAPRGPRGVQVGPRWWQDTGILSHTMPQPSQVPLWALKSQIWAKIWPEMPPHFGHSCLAWT